jgi:capsular polysaccharide biosynthesis protein
MAHEKKSANKYDFASIDILFYIWDKKLPLAIITVIAGIISIIVSFTIKPLYKSSLVIYPTSNGFFVTIDEEAQAEQLLQVIISEDVKNMVIAKNDLMKHYNINPLSEFPLTNLDFAYQSNVKVRKTEYGSIQVDVLDHDPQMAANIANDISSLTDTVYNNILRKKAQEVLPIVEKEFFYFLKTYQEIKDSLDVIRALGINNYNVQADRYHQSYVTAILNGNERAIKILDEKFKILAKYGGTYEILSINFSKVSEEYARLKERYRMARADAEQTYPHQFVVNKAFKAEKKTYPKKAIIVTVSTLSAFLLGLILLMIGENFKKRIK